MSLIKPRLLKGFRDFLPQQIWQRRYVIDVFIKTFEKYGYEPLETPTLEYFDILMGKYGEQEKLVYNFEDFGKRRVALRYDLTVPASRVIASYQNDLILPWKRYQIQPVWRADNTQKGRFREFYQCDADIFGSTSMLADAEYIQMGIEILNKLGFNDFQVLLNNRKILNGITKYVGREDKFMDIVFVIDDWYKRSLEDNLKELKNRGLNDNESQKIFDLLTYEGEDKLSYFAAKLTGISDAESGIKELRTIMELVKDAKVKFTPTIARGLSYYTGPIWEWYINEGNVGSVGGCGRYDKLVGSFIGNEIPATGGSFGLERIMEVLTERKMLEETKSEIKVMVSVFNEEFAPASFEMATQLRSKGIPVLLFPGIRPLKKQFEYASKKGIPYVIVMGEDEKALGVVGFKDMYKKEQKVIPLDDVIEILLSE